MPDTARTVCGRPPTADHPADWFCARCLHRTRSDLNTVADLYALLPAELTGHGAAATPPDPTGIRGGSDYLVDAWVLYAPGTVGTVVASRLGDRTHAVDQLESDPISTPAMLSGWEDVWRSILNLPAAGTQRNGHKWRDIYPCIVDVTATVQFIQQNLVRLSRDVLFAEMASDIHQQRTRLEIAIRVNRPNERPAVDCPQCGGPLVKRFRPPDPCPPGCQHRGDGHDQGGRRDDWWCRDCGIVTVESYWLAIAERSQQEQQRQEQVTA